MTLYPKIWITVFTGNSGLTHYSYCLARALTEEGADITLVTNANYELDFMPAEFPIIKIFHRSRRYPADMSSFWNLYRRQRPDIVHYQSFLKFPAAELLLLELQKKKGTGLVCTAHDWLPHHERFYHKHVLGSYYRAFDRVVVHSERGRNFLSGTLGVKRERLAVIPHGDYGFFATDPKLTREEALRRLGLRQEQFWFLIFGRIDSHKGIDLALRAMAASDGRFPALDGAGLIIAGNPKRGGLEEYTSLIAGQSLGDRVKLIPGHVPVEDVQLYFRAADAVVLPYRESSTSGIAHLAMGFDLPVVATNVGGMADVIEDGVTGLMVPPGDEPALRTAMARLAGDQEIRHRFSQGWTAARERHSWKAIALQTRDIYGLITGNDNEA